jgi:hypothetical protein
MVDTSPALPDTMSLPLSQTLEFLPGYALSITQLPPDFSLGLL